MKTLFLHIVLICFACTTYAQVDQLKTDIVSAAEVMESMLPVVMYSSYTLYATHDTTEVMSKARGEVYLTKSSYYQSIEGVHTFIEGSQVAIINEEERTIVFDSKEIDLQQLIFNVNIDQIPDYLESIQVDENEKARIYDLSLSPFSSFNKVKLTISKQTNLISNVELFYANSQGLENTLQEEETPRLVVDIETKSLNGKVSYSLSSNPFFAISDEGFTRKSKYSSYSVINNITGDE